MEISETRRILIIGLKLILKDPNLILGITIMLQTEEQMKEMIYWIYDHQNEEIEAEEVVEVALKITEQVK